MTAKPERGGAGHWRVALPALSALALVLLAGGTTGATAVLLFAAVLLLTAWAVGRGRRVDGSLQTFANLLDALREGDFSVRSATDHPRTAELSQRFNALAAHLQDEQRTGQEQLHLLGKTLAALDGAVFAFQHDGRLRLVNPAGERLLAQPATRLLGCSAEQLGLLALFESAEGAIRSLSFAGRSGRWQIGHAELRSRGLPGRLLVLQPVERALRAEEAQAFRRLLRVLSHEINNSLAPIASLADTAVQLLPPAGEAMSADRLQDLHDSLRVIEQRSAALQRFLGGYAGLARLPPARPMNWPLAPLCRRVRQLLDEPRIRWAVAEDLSVHADPDQLEQVLLNLLRNALEASAAAGRNIEVGVAAEREQGRVRIRISDNGPGPPPSENLFVPFFTTKPGGSGIGLVLSRQILQAQEGDLVLKARSDAPGCVAVIDLPAATTASADEGPLDA